MESTKWKSEERQRDNERLTAQTQRPERRGRQKQRIESGIRKRKPRLKIEKSRTARESLWR